MKKETVTEIIAQRAFEIFEARGGEHGQDMSDWLQAEREVLARTGSAKNLTSSSRRKRS